MPWRCIPFLSRKQWQPCGGTINELICTQYHSKNIEVAPSIKPGQSMNDQLGQQKLSSTRLYLPVQGWLHVSLISHVVDMSWSWRLTLWLFEMLAISPVHSQGLAARPLSCKKCCVKVHGIRSPEGRKPRFKEASKITKVQWQMTWNCWKVNHIDSYWTYKSYNTHLTEVEISFGNSKFPGQSVSILSKATWPIVRHGIVRHVSPCLDCLLREGALNANPVNGPT